MHLSLAPGSGGKRTLQATDALCVFIAKLAACFHAAYFVQAHPQGRLLSHHYLLIDYQMQTVHLLERQCATYIGTISADQDTQILRLRN